MSQTGPAFNAQEFLARMGGGAQPAEIADLFSETVEWEIAGDDGALPWIGKKTGRSAVVECVANLQTLLEPLRFDVHDILDSGNRAVILGSLASKVNKTGKVIETDFAIVITVSSGEIVRYQMLEDSFAVSQAARRSME